MPSAHDIITVTMRKGLFLVLLGGILAVAIFLRLYKLGTIPYSLYWDEAAMFVDVKSVLATGRDMHNRPWYQVIYPSYGDFKLPAYIWVATLSAKTFGFSEWSLRLPSVLAGLGTILLAGVLAKSFAKTLKPHVVQLVAMTIVAVSPWSILFSRTGFEGHLGQFLLALSVWCIFASKKRWWLIILAAFFGAAATYSYFSVRFVWVVVFVLVTLYVYRDQLTFSKKSLPLTLKMFVLPLIVFSVLLVPMLKSPLYNDANRFRLGTDSILNTDNQVNQANVFREMAGNTRTDRVLFHPLWLTGEALLKNYSDNLNPNFLFITGDPNLRHGTGQQGLFLWPLLPFLLIGLYYFFTRDKFAFLVLILWWLVALLPASVPLNTPHALRSLNALVPLAILLGAGVSFGYEKILTFKFGRATMIGYAVIFLFAATEFSYNYFTLYPRTSAKDWQDGYKQLAQAIFATQKNGQKVFVLPFDDRFYLWLMAYGPYTGQDFHNWKSRDYKFEDSVPNITSQIPDKSNLMQPTLVAAEPNRFQELLPSFGVKPIQVQEIHGSDGTVRFVLASFGPQ